MNTNKIMDISISFDIANDGNFKYYEDFYTGTILIDKNLNFEGIIDTDKYITGKLLADEVISFADFNNDYKSSHYCGINQESNYIGKNTIYSDISKSTQAGSILIKLKESTKEQHFKENLPSKIEILKNNFDENTQNTYDWFKENIDTETKKVLSSIRSDLNKKLTNVLKEHLANHHSEKTKSLK